MFLAKLVQPIPHITVNKNKLLQKQYKYVIKLTFKYGFTDRPFYIFILYNHFNCKLK